MSEFTKECSLCTFSLCTRSTISLLPSRKWISKFCETAPAIECSIQQRIHFTNNETASIYIYLRGYECIYIYISEPKREERNRTRTKRNIIQFIVLCFVSIFARLLSIRFVNASKENLKRRNARKCFNIFFLLRLGHLTVCASPSTSVISVGFPHSFIGGFFFWLFSFRAHSVYFIFIAFGNAELQSNSLWTLQFLLLPPHRFVEYICFSLSSNCCAFLRCFILSALAR